MSDPLFDRMLAEARGTFTLAAATEGVEVAAGREAQLVEMALTAGVLGALTVEREAASDLDVAALRAKVEEVLALLPER